MEEVWVAAVGWEDYYEVSNLGNIRRRKNSPGRYKTQRPVKQFELKKPSGDQGYLTCRFKVKSKGQKTLYVHRLVCEAFHGAAPASSYQCCHNDGNKHNNQVENLRWDTRSANEMDRVAHGTSNRGSRHGMSKLVEDDVLQIRLLLKGGLTQKVVAEMFGVASSTVQSIKSGKNWSHLEG